MKPSLEPIITDLAAEQADVDRIVAGLDDAGWDRATAAEGWAIRDQISHLAHFDEQAVLAIEDGEAFVAGTSQAIEHGVDPMHHHLETGRALDTAELLEWWRTARHRLTDAAARLASEQRIPWYGPPMRPETFLVARLMETWAHGHDIAEALDIDRPPTDRLFRVAELGVKTFRFAFENRDMQVPDGRVRVALRGPSGIVKVWNDEWDSSVTGPLEEFCLVVAQRLHPGDTHLVLEGGLARKWMEVAQVFAGPPGPGRAFTGILSN